MPRTKSYPEGSPPAVARVIASAVFIIRHDEQRRRPPRPAAQRIVDGGNELLAGSDTMRRMLVVREVHIRQISGLDERVGGQIAVLGIVQEIIEQEEIEGKEPKPREVQGQR